MLPGTLSLEHASAIEDKRKIPAEIAAELGIVSNGNKIGFEYREKGIVKFVKWRGPHKQFWIEPAGVPLLPWNLDSLSEASGQDHPLILTEGEWDAASCVAVGAPCVLSVPNGAPSRPGQGDIIPAQDRLFAWLWYGDFLRHEIAKFSKIILCTDGDEPGRVLASELAVRLGRDRCWLVSYPDELIEELGRQCKDANEVLVHLGADRLTEILANAKPIVPNRLVPFSDIPRRANRIQYSSGWAGLDDHLRLQLPELMIVTGAPNSGKSTWTINYVCNLARIHGLKTAILQFEDDVDRNRDDIERYMRAWNFVSNGEKAISDPDEWIDRMFRTIAPAEEHDAYDMAWLKASIVEAATRHDCRVVLIDPFNEIEHLWKVNESETQYTNNCLRDLKKLCRQLQIAIIIVTHPTKTGGAPKPIEEWSLYDVAGSAAWNNKADHGVVIWRENSKAPETFVKVSKSKNFRTMGTPGTVIMRYEQHSSSFYFMQKAGV